jgi:hypothetical protein
VELQSFEDLVKSVNNFWLNQVRLPQQASV